MLSPLAIILGVVALLLAGALYALSLRLKRLREEGAALAQQRDAAAAERDALTARFKPILDLEAERDRVTIEIEVLRRESARSKALAEAEQQEHLARVSAMSEEAERQWAEHERQAAALRAQAAQLQAEVNALNETAHLYEFGLYEPRFDFASSELYAKRLEVTRNNQKAMVKAGTAAVAQAQMTLDGSVQKGQRMLNEHIKLMLRAFNGECDAAVARVRYNNVQVMEQRIEKAYEAVNKLGSSKRCAITRAYLDLKLAELHLAHEYHEKRHEEAEEQRRIREQMREEERALREIEKAQREAERDEQRYEEALARAREEAERAVGARQEKLAGQIAELERRLAEAHALKERAISRAQMTRSGHVYVISNVGSFGEEVFKIGMTRRLDPMERILELGDASVPFRFDVHAIIYSDDAPSLEYALHRTFQGRRVNRVNERKEFFRVTLEEIERVVHENHGHIEFTKVAEAEEYRKTLALLESARLVPMPPLLDVPLPSPVGGADGETA
jgi:hypothetical protein